MSFTKKFYFLIAIVAGLFSQACHSAKATSGQVAQIGSHQVILHRDSFWVLKRFASTILVSQADGKETELKYKSYLSRFEIRLKDDAVYMNDILAGNLHKGDAVHLDDQGLTINEMDRGESEKYLNQTLVAQK